MKKILAILLTVIMVFGLVACGDKKDDQAKDTDKAEEVEQDADEKDAETPAEGSEKFIILTSNLNKINNGKNWQKFILKRQVCRLQLSQQLQVSMKQP